MSTHLFSRPTGPLTAASARDLHAHWVSIRRAYPGWEVAPKSSRDSIWRTTEAWIEPILNFRDHVDPPHQMSLIAELIWRLNISLAPLFIDWVSKITPVLESLNPFPATLELPTALILPESSGYSDLDWSRLGEEWFDIASALLTEARDDQDEGRFELWAARLDRIVQEHPDWQAKLAHERCLFSLMRLDHDKVRSLVERWPQRGVASIWEIRRAAVFAELGQLEQAERIAEAALADVRARLMPTQAEISLLSQEGWAMVFLGMLKLNYLSDEARDARDYYLDRLQSLNAHYCNPWVELELLGALVRLPGPVPKLPRATVEGFDPGRSYVKYRFGPSVHIYELLPAFAMLRMLELGGIPPRVGMVSLNQEEVMRAAGWIEIGAPLWSLGVRLRTAQKESLEGFLSRAIVATLAPDRLSLLFALARQGLEREFREIASPSRRESLSNAAIRLGLFAEILSRLAFRISEHERLNMLFFALELARAIEAGRVPNIAEVGSLIERILFAMTSDELKQVVGQLLEFPLSTENPADKVAAALEPAGLIDPSAGRVPPQHIPRSAISRLARVAIENGGVPRSRALWRLVRVHELGGLTIQEEQQLGNVLWARTDQASGLPSDLPFGAHSILSLPEPEPDLAKARLREYLLHGDYRRVKDGIFAQADPYVTNLLQASARLWRRDQSRFIDWNHEEALSLLDKAVAWWDEENASFSRSSEVDPLGDPREQFDRLLEVLALVIIPRLRRTDEKAIATVERLLDEAQERGLVVLVALPFLLQLRPSIFNDVASRIRLGLSSSREEDIKTATNAAYFWLEQSPDSGVEVMRAPNDIVDAMVSMVTSRRRPGLLSLMEAMTHLAKENPALLDEGRIDALCIGLQHMAEETELTEEAVRRIDLGDPPIIPLNERPKYRAAAAALAKILSELSAALDRSPHAVLERWGRIGRDDVLPEVRRAWARVGLQNAG